MKNEKKNVLIQKIETSPKWTIERDESGRSIHQSEWSFTRIYSRGPSNFGRNNSPVLNLDFLNRQLWQTVHFRYGQENQKKNESLP